MSKSNIRETDKLILMGRAGGMCEFPGCGALLYEDPLTKQKLNWTNLAHIIGDSSEGPRGEKDASEKYMPQKNRHQGGRKKISRQSTSSNERRTRKTD